jgi:hypothetical protein
MLEVQGDRAWHDIVTLDESRFYLSTDYEFIWQSQESDNERFLHLRNRSEADMIDWRWCKSEFQMPW